MRTMTAHERELRDQFATAAVTGLITQKFLMILKYPVDIVPSAVAEEAYKIADAMLKERNK